MGQEESRVYAGVGHTKKEAARHLENLLRFYLHSKYRVVWYCREESAELRVERPDKSLVVVVYKQDKETGLYSCEVVL